MDRRDRDKRVQRTRADILGSFNDLALRRRYDDIQVADVIAGAGVGRSTFYEHFRNKDDVLAGALTGILSVLADACTDAANPAALAHIVEHFREHRALVRQMLADPARVQITHHLADQVAARLRGRALTIPLALAASLIAESALGLVRAWLDRVEPCSSTDLAAALSRSGCALAESLTERPAKT